MSRRKQYIEKLAEVLILNPAGERRLAMFSAYLDESGKGHERDSFLAVGGLVSSSLQWGRLQSEWVDHLKRLPRMPLDEQGRPRPFHMTDFESGHWPIRNYQWRSEKAKARFLDGLLDIMRYRVKLRVFTVIWLGHYHKLFPGDKKFKFPWVMSALGCASRIAKWGEQKAQDPIPFIFERGGEGWSIALENHRRLEEKGQLGKTKIGSWTLDDKQLAGLQAADLWAWELRHHFQAQLPERQPYILRPSLEKLMIGVPDGSGFVIGRKRPEHADGRLEARKVPNPACPILHKWIADVRPRGSMKPEAW
ncbi:MAG TPA: DUF3800 domain-containing protein [Bryobacteraceae bacterium]|nr:DUF3800 domain-containing protein [Bryobacteraceae bacterium]